MALIKCPECGKEISEKAPACIHCGCPINNNSHNTEPPKEERFKIILNSDINKIETIKLLMEIKGVSLETGKNIIDTCPITIFDSLTLTEAQDIISKFNKIGSDVTIGQGNSKAVVINDTAISNDKGKETIETTPINIQPNNNTSKNMGCTVAIIIAIVVAILAVIIGSSEDHNDGKCDICGKSATNVSSNAELCTYHILWANDEYYKDNENYEGFGTH